MLEGLLPDNINVYGTTASNAEESSYACYYDAKRNTYLGGCLFRSLDGRFGCRENRSGEFTSTIFSNTTENQYKPCDAVWRSGRRERAREREDFFYLEFG